MMVTVELSLNVRPETIARILGRPEADIVSAIRNPSSDKALVREIEQFLEAHIKTESGM